MILNSIFKNGVFIAIIAHGLIGASLVWDKALLIRRGTQNLISYIFWLGGMSILGLVLMFFGFHLPGWDVIALAIGTGALQMLAIYFYYRALKAGEASETLAIMGGFSPVATVLLGLPLLSTTIAGGDLLAFALLTGAGFVMFLSEKLGFRKLLPLVLIAAALSGLVNVLQRRVFMHTGFISGYVFFTIGTFLAAMSLLARPKWRREIFTETKEAEPRSRFWYLVNRFFNGLGSFLVFYAISLTNPAIVDAISGVRYAVIFLVAYLLTKLRPRWLKEVFTGRVLVAKTVATLMVVVGLVLLAMEGDHAGGSGPATRLWHYRESRAIPTVTSAAPIQRVWLTSSRSISRASKTLIR